MAKYEVVVEEKHTYRFLNVEAETALEARVMTIDLLENGELEADETSVEAVSVEVQEEGDGSLGAVLQEIADHIGVPLKAVEEWAQDIDEDRFVAESVEELAEELSEWSGLDKYTEDEGADPGS